MKNLSQHWSIAESVTALKRAIDQADTPDGPRPYLFDTLSLRDAKRILQAWDDAGLVNGPRFYVHKKSYTDGRVFQCFFNFLGWHCWSLGLHVDPTGPYVECHVPFGFVRVGWVLQRVNQHVHAFGWRG